MKEYSADKKGGDDAAKPAAATALKAGRAASRGNSAGEYGIKASGERGTLAGEAWSFGKMRAPGGPADPAMARQGQANSSGEAPTPEYEAAGRRLDSMLVEQLKRSTGVDLSDVLLRTDPQLAEQGKAGAAEGGDSVRLAPDSSKDEQVIRHELGHLLQQRNAQGRGPAQLAKSGENGDGAVGAEGSVGTAERGPEVSGESSAETVGAQVDLEAEADDLARAAAARESFEVRGEGQGVLYEETPEAVAEAAVPAEAEPGTPAPADASAALAQEAIIKGLEEDHLLYVAELEKLTASSRERVREALPALPELAGMTSEAIEKHVDSRLGQILSKSLESLKVAKASLVDNPEPRGELRKKQTEILATYESDLTLFASDIPGANPLPPLVKPLEGEDLTAHLARLAQVQKAVYETWQAITSGFREGVGKTSTLPADLQEECVTSLTAKYDEYSAALHALYPKAEEPLKEEAVTNLEGTLSTIAGSAQGMYENWLDARLAQAVSEANPLQPTGRPDVDGAVQGARKGAAGAKDVVTPYGSIEEVKAAQKAWLRRLELAWLAGSEQILDWAVGLQSEEALGTLKQLSLKEENYKAADLDELAVKVPAALAPAEKILLAGAIEARRNFELMRTALTQAPIHPEKPKDGTYKDLPIMSPS